MRRLWVVCDEWRTRGDPPKTNATPISNVYPNTNFFWFQFLKSFFPLIKKKKFNRLHLLEQFWVYRKVEQKEQSSHLLPHPQFSLLTSCISVIYLLQ